MHMDNFSTYGTLTALMTNNIYAEINSGTGLSVQLVADPDGVSPGTVLQMQGNNDNGSTPWRYANPNGTQDVIGAAFRYWLPNLPTNNNGQTAFISVRNVNNVQIGQLAVMSTGALRFRIYDNDYLTTVPVISANGWWHIEIRYHNTAADTVSFEVRVEGQTVLTRTALAVPVQVPPQPLQPAQIGASRANISGDGLAFYKDLALWDNTGTTNTNFLGSVLVINLTPSADVNLNWTPTPAGTGFTILDNVPPNDAQFIAAGTPPPAAYVSEMTNLPINITSIRAVMSFVRAGKSDGGDGNLQVGLISAASTVLGANRPITTSPTYWRDFFPTDPATAAAWLPAAVNAARLQINRIS